jgi:hypothetical protein
MPCRTASWKSLEQEYAMLRLRRDQFEVLDARRSARLQAIFEKRMGVGFLEDDAIIKFTFISVFLGLHFEQDPLLKDHLQSTLWQNPGVSPNVGLNRIFDALNPKVPLRDSVPPTHLCYLISGKHLPTVSHMDQIDRILPDLVRLTPDRRVPINEANVRTAIYAYDEARAATGLAASKRHSYFWLSFFLGFRFHDNPLYKPLFDRSFSRTADDLQPFSALRSYTSECE